jgi:hypothetical protein
MLSVIYQPFHAKCRYTECHIQAFYPDCRNVECRGAFFTLLLIIEEATEKILKHIMALKSIYDKNFVFISKSVKF